MHCRYDCRGKQYRPFILIASADYARGEIAHPPELLELGFQVEQYGALPTAGGLYDQPAGLMQKLRMVMNVYHAHRQYYKNGNKPGEAAKWKQEHEDLYDIVLDIKELREQNG
jgi:hypothetical protein